MKLTKEMIEAGAKACYEKNHEIASEYVDETPWSKWAHIDPAAQSAWRFIFVAGFDAAAFAGVLALSEGQAGAKQILARAMAQHRADGGQ